jgi:hypothetical protein
VTPEGGDLRGPLQATEAVREGVRLGIRDALARDVDRTSVRTVRRLAIAGALGLASAAAAVALFARGASDRANPLHLALCAAAWSSVLVIAYAFVLLRVGSRRFPVAQASLVALLGLAVASFMGLVCPHPMMLDWWMETPLGGLVQDRLGLEASTLCIGLCLAVMSAGVASFVAAVVGWGGAGVVLSAGLLFVTVWPAIAVQSLGSSPTTLLSWTVGLALGSAIGVALARSLWRLLGLVRRPAH